MLYRISSHALLLVLLTWPMLAIASEAGRNLQAIRSEAFNVCNRALLYFNPNVRHGGRDPSHAAEYRRSLKQLRGLIDSLQDTQLTAPLEIMERLLAELEHRPTSDESRYAHWLNPILQAHADLDSRADQLYGAATLAPNQALIDAISLNIAKLNLLYQTRTFGALQFFLGDDNSNDPFEELDRRIIEGFDEAEIAWPNIPDAISTSRRNYNFVRNSLLANGEHWVQASAAYYLGKTTRALNSLSAQQPPNE